MNGFCVCTTALLALAVGGCAGDTGGSGTYRGYGGSFARCAPSDTYDMSYDERHRVWWDQNRPDSNYERIVARREHERFCRSHPDDPSCRGWFQP